MRRFAQKKHNLSAKNVTTQPSPLERGWPATAFSPAVAGRVRGLFLPSSDGTNPSPVVLRLVKAPEADTLSPRERAESRAWGTSAICRNEAGMSMKTKESLFLSWVKEGVGHRR
jgi:hypothetical protein